MAQQNYIPRRDGDFVSWVQAFSAELTTSGTSVGLGSAEIAAAQSEIADTVEAIHSAVAQRNAAQAATAAKQQRRRDIETVIRSFVRRIKAHPQYTEALGQTFRIIGPEDTRDLGTSKPTLTAESVLPLAVAIRFNKSVSDGVRILSKRGTETGFTPLAIDTTSPYVDRRPNLAAGPETRQYQAQYLADDEPVGLLSDTLVVTVPG